MKLLFEKNKILEKGFYLSVFLVSLPPIFFIFSRANSHTFAKLIWLFIFFVLAVRFYQKGFNLKIDRGLLVLFLLYYVSQSFSIINAMSPVAFLERYEDFFFASIFFFVTTYIVNKKKVINNILYILFAASILNIIFQLLIFKFPDFITGFGRFFIHEGYIEIIQINIQRQRIYAEVYDEMLIPIIIYLIVKSKDSLEKVFYAVLFFLISIFSFLSNFRTRFLMMVVALASAYAILFQRFKKITYFLLALVAVLYIGYTFLFRALGFTVIERVLLEDQPEDVSTITSRVTRWNKSVEMGLSSPIFGVGLGNYYDNLDFSMQRVFSPYESILREFELASYYPHNLFFRVFAETGFFGLAALTLLFVYFIKVDLKILRKSNYLAKAFIISFWILIIHALFNPSSTVKYQVFFWLFRVLIEKVDTMKINNLKLFKKFY